MILKTDKGTKEYKVKDLDFTNVMCDLEDKGVDIMKMLNDGSIQDGRTFTTVRTLTAALIGEDDMKKAGTILSTHLRNGGSLDTIFEAFTEVMKSAGFGETAGENEETAENE